MLSKYFIVQSACSPWSEDSCNQHYSSETAALHYALKKKMGWKLTTDNGDKGIPIWKIYVMPSQKSEATIRVDVLSNVHWH